MKSSAIMPPTATDSAFNTPVSAAVVVTQDDSEDTDNGDSPACSRLSQLRITKRLQQMRWPLVSMEFRSIAQTDT